VEGCALFILAGASALVLLALIVGMIVSSASGRTGEAEMMRRLAALVGGKYTPSGGWWLGTLEWTVRGREAALRRFDEPSGFTTGTRVVVDMRGHSPGTLKIVPAGAASKLRLMYSRQDLDVGDAAFDRDFIVRANPPSLAASVFSPERRARVVASVRKLSRRGTGFIDLRKQALEVGVTETLTGWHELLGLVESANEFVHYILDVEPSAGILWIEDKPSGGGQCQVCGTGMREGVVHCASCKTPHHEECWKYMGECSTFACKETRYVADGKVVRPTGARLKPDEALRREIERDRRESGGGRRP